MTEANSARALVIVPTYNEAENIEQLVREILAQPAPLDIVVVDDNSPDGTGRLADALSTQDARVGVLHRAGKQGLGTAYIAGFKHALSRGYAYAITMDADFSHNPRYLPQLLGLMDAYDLGIGSRYVPGGGSTRAPTPLPSSCWGSKHTTAPPAFAATRPRCCGRSSWTQSFPAATPSWWRW